VFSLLIGLVAIATQLIWAGLPLRNQSFLNAACCSGRSNCLSVDKFFAQTNEPIAGFRRSAAGKTFRLLLPRKRLLHFLVLQISVSSPFLQHGRCLEHRMVARLETLINLEAADKLYPMKG
jgi:hypothetical protein